MFYVVLLAMVAGFLALRLYSVLGKRTGHEQPLPRAAEERVAVPAAQRTIDAAPERGEAAVTPLEGLAAQGLRQIIAAEPGFDVGQFVGGAQAAYRMILEAYWAGDEATLRDLAEPPVADAFVGAIAARAEKGEVLDNRLVTIERATISEASVAGKQARITMRFDADIAAVTRDAEGNVVAGSTDDAVETHDVWTFARTLKSADPNWKLADTDEA